MSDYRALVDQYISIWNEPEAIFRYMLIDETWTEDATYQDPVLQVGGHAGIDDFARSVQSSYPGCRFRLTSDVEQVGETIRFSWALTDPFDERLMAGTVFALISWDGRLRSVHGFFDKVLAYAL